MKKTYSATTSLRYSAGEKAEMIPDTYKEVTTLPTKVQLRAASYKEVTSQNNKNV